MDKETDTIDRLFLELSQFAKAKTNKEIDLEKRLSQWMQFAGYCRSCALSGEHDPHDFQGFLAHSDNAAWAHLYKHANYETV